MGIRMTWAALAVAGSMAASGPAHAVASDFFASLGWSSTIYSLVDLTPDDGIGTAFDWTTPSVGTSGVSVIGGTSFQIADWTSPLTASSSTIVAQANALETRLDGVGVASGGFFQEASAARYGDFVLGPGTAVVFSLPAQGAVQALPGLDVILNAQIFASGPSGSGFTSDSIDLGNGQSTARLLSITLRNETANPLNGHFSSNVGVNVISSVPEPSAYAMLVAGMGLLAGVALRRRRA